jgi:hypothetical protein
MYFARNFQAGGDQTGHLLVNRQLSIHSPWLEIRKMRIFEEER